MVTVTVALHDENLHSRTCDIYFLCCLLLSCFLGFLGPYSKIYRRQVTHSLGNQPASNNHREMTLPIYCSQLIGDDSTVLMMTGCLIL